MLIECVIAGEARRHPPGIAEAVRIHAFRPAENATAGR
jgi:hypothetical protein